MNSEKKKKNADKMDRNGWKDVINKKNLQNLYGNHFI